VLHDPQGVEGQWGYDADGDALEGYTAEGYEHAYHNGHQNGEEYDDSQQGARRRARGGRGSRRWAFQADVDRHESLIYDGNWPSRGVGVEGERWFGKQKVDFWVKEACTCRWGRGEGGGGLSLFEIKEACLCRGGWGWGDFVAEYIPPPTQNYWMSLKKACICRGSDRRRGSEPRGSWADAAVDALEQQFSYSRSGFRALLVDLFGVGIGALMTSLLQHFVV